MFQNDMLNGFIRCRIEVDFKSLDLFALQRTMKILTKKQDRVLAKTFLKIDLNYCSFISIFSRKFKTWVNECSRRMQVILSRVAGGQNRIMLHYRKLIKSYLRTIVLAVFILRRYNCLRRLNRLCNFSVR